MKNIMLCSTFRRNVLPPFLGSKSEPSKKVCDTQSKQYVANQLLTYGTRRLVENKWDQTHRKYRFQAALLN
jgi:hypothetical protein